MPHIDIAYLAGVLSQNVTNPSEGHVGSAIFIFAYLQGKKKVGLIYQTGQPNVIGYVDSDWARCLDIRQSTTGYVFSLAGGPVS